MSGSQGGSPVDDLTYDLITALQNKLQAVTAYDAFLGDARRGDEQCRRLFEQLRQDDARHAGLLRQELARHLGRG